MLKHFGSSGVPRHHTEREGHRQRVGRSQAAWSLLTCAAPTAHIASGTAWEPGQLLQRDHDVLPAPLLLKIGIAAFRTLSSS